MRVRVAHSVAFAACLISAVLGVVMAWSMPGVFLLAPWLLIAPLMWWLIRCETRRYQ